MNTSTIDSASNVLPSAQTRLDTAESFKQFAEFMDLKVLNELLSRKQSGNPIGAAK